MFNEERKTNRTGNGNRVRRQSAGSGYGDRSRHQGASPRRNFNRIRSFSSDKTTGTTQPANNTTPQTNTVNPVNTPVVSQVFHSDRSPLLRRASNQRRNSEQTQSSYKTRGKQVYQAPLRRTTSPGRSQNRSGAFFPNKFTGTPNEDKQREKNILNPDFIKPETEGTPKDDVIRIIPLGGVEEIGKNMTVVEYKDDIVIVDMGLQFPGEEAPGVDYIIPDATYLQKKKKNIRGVFITHGHLDHIGGIPYMMDRIGNPTIYARFLPSLLIKKRQEEFPHLPALNLRVVEKESRLKVGKHLTVRFFNVTHTIPDSMGVIIETPYGNVVFTGDVKVDHNDGVPLQHEIETFEKLGKEKNLVLLADSTNVEKPGWSFSERMVHENLKKIILESKGRLIIGTFASLLERIIFIIKTAEEAGKKVVLRGKSMKGNIAIAREIKILNVKPTTIIPPEEIDNYPDDRIIILATGAQGDEMAALMRMAQKKDKYVKLKKTDVILLSSSIIPGNEKSVQKLKDNLSRQGAKIIHYRVADVHSSGHANYDEILWIHKMIKAKYFIPVHGHHFMLRVHADVARAAGMRDENIVIPDNGTIIEIANEGNTIRTAKDAVPAGVVMVDGLGNGDVSDVVIRDRQVLAQDGMFVIIAVIDMKTGKIKQSPDIISRGFVYLKESQELLKEVRNLTKKTIEKVTIDMHPINLDFVKNNLREKIAKFLFQNTAKRPIILPVILEV